MKPATEATTLPVRPLIETVGCVKRTARCFSARPVVRFTHPTRLKVRFTHAARVRAVAFSAAILLVACSVLPLAPLVAQQVMVPNPELTEGDAAPTGWTLSGGQGRWVDRQLVEVTGTGSDSNYWACDGVRFEPGKLYHFQMRARRTSGAGCVIAGPSFANRDYRGLSNDWKWYGHVFRAPESTERAYLRLGQWEAQGTVQFDAVQLAPAIPVHRQMGDLILGEGETIRDGVYQFQGTFDHEGGNYHRVLLRATAGFNSNRWTFGRESEVVYRFEVPGHKLLSGDVSFNVNYHTRGGCLAEASRDAKQWHPLVTQPELGAGEAVLPDDVLPAETLFLRLRSSPVNSSFQVNRIELRAKLSEEPDDATGRTAFARLLSTSPDLEIRRLALGGSLRDRRPWTWLKVTARNTGKESATLQLHHHAISTAGSGPMAAGWVAPDEEVTSQFTLPSGAPGFHVVTLEVTGRNESGNDSSVKADMFYFIPDFYRTDYGELLGSGNWPVAVWWCDAAHKVARHRAPPTGYAPAARLAAARNDWEAVQIVVSPGEAPGKKQLSGLTAKPGPLVGPDGATIPEENVRILRVYYHFVDHPTDKTGVRDWWPDALPPLDSPVDVPLGENQPLWVLVYVPDDAKPGDYRGQLRLEAEGWSATVPIKLHVWDFALPKRNHIQTAFGFSAGNVFRYHQLKTEEDKRRVLDMYLRCFSEHRISPYDPTPMDPIGVKFLPQADPPRAELDFSAFDRALTRAVEEFHFTGFRLPIHGMGGGSFHARYEPKIEGFGEKSPEYQAMFSSYVQQLEEHFREKGWLEMPYIYWFDEPAPKDYEFVRSGFERLKKYAPGLLTMLTEQPEEALAGPVDVWCPVSPNYDHEAAEKRRAHGDRFWWYVCTGPKAPYCTLFIDHPATELRVWLWQTWQRNIVGVLVWQATYWTSSAAFPDKPQNPYEDPMGYVSGYSTPRGVKRYWGNGDGRFVYPPLAAAVPGASGPDAVIRAPVSSIRWQMLREGIEDYEYLYLLRELVAEKRDRLSADEIKKYEALLEVPESITKDMTTFTTDPAPVYARRALVAEAIEQLMK